MSYAEGLRLVQVLATDPSSRIACALAGWDYPFSTEAKVLADLYDLTHKAAAGRRSTKPYPRPWDKKRTRYGRITRSQAEIRAALRARGYGRVLHTRDANGRLRDDRGRFTKP